MQCTQLKILLIINMLTMHAHMFSAQSIFQRIADDARPFLFSELTSGAKAHQITIQRVMTAIMTLATSEKQHHTDALEALVKQVFCKTPIEKTEKIATLRRRGLLNESGQISPDIQSVIGAAIAFDQEYVPLSIIRSPLAGHYAFYPTPLQSMAHNQDSPIAVERDERRNLLILTVSNRHGEKPHEKRVCLREDNETTEDPLPYFNFDFFKRYGVEYFNDYLYDLRIAYEYNETSFYDFHQQLLARARQRMQESY